MNDLDLLITSTEGILISLMITITRKRLQFEPANCVENLFDCTTFSECDCAPHLPKVTKRAMQYLFKPLSVVWF